MPSARGVFEVSVPAEYLADLAVLGKYRLQALAVGQAHLVKPSDTYRPRVVVEKQYGTLVASALQVGLQPLKLGYTEVT